MRRILLAAATAWLVSLPAAPAAAQEGVTIDRDSPSGKEYELPLDDARRKGAGNDDGAATGGSGTPGAGSGGRPAAPAFGVGISPQDVGAGAGSGGPGAPADATVPGGAGGADRSGQSAPPGLSGRPSPSSDSGSRGGYAIALTAGVAVAVLGLGGAAGFALRRRTTPAG